MSAPIVALDGVGKSFGADRVLENISAGIGAGEFFSLLGPSGCGKTTLLRIIAGFEEATTGTLAIDGRPMAGVPPNRRPTNMVFQSYAIFPHLSVAENVGFGLRRAEKAERDRRIGEALEMVGLGGRGTRPAGSLSGGQRQRVALARALVLRPKVLLLDEPLSALDRKLREAMQGELRRLQRQLGITFLLVTHDQEEALILSDRIAVMFEGRIAQLADPQTLYRWPVNRRVGEFIGIMNVLPAEVDVMNEACAAVEVAGLGRAELTAEQAPGGIPSSAAYVGIRPETMAILAPGEGTARRVAEGTVEECAYYGDMTYYDVRLAGTEHAVTVAMKNEIGAGLLDRGDGARVAWDAGALVLFSS